MVRYSVPWSAFGIATVEAASPKEAEELVSEGIFDWSGDIDWEDNEINGADIQDAEEK